MRIDHAPQHAQTPASQPAAAPQPTEDNTRPAPAPKGKAHGVVRKLGTDHFNPTAEARLTAHFGHLIPPPPVDPVQEPGEGTGIIDEPIEEYPAEDVAPAPVDVPTELPADGVVVDEQPQVPAVDNAADAELIEDIQDIIEQSREEAAEEQIDAPLTTNLTYTADGLLEQTRQLIGQSLDVVG